MKKICSKCEIEKELSEFHKNVNGKDGRGCICKICTSEIKRIYYINNKEHIAEYHRQYRIDNKEHIAECRRQYCIDNKEHLVEYNRQHRIDNPEIHKKYQHKANAKRHGWEKPRPINQPFEGSHLHHLHIENDHQIAIYIPEKLHRSVWHAHNKPKTMFEINTLAFEWLATQDII